MTRGRPTKKDLAALEQRDRDEFESRYAEMENCLQGLRRRAADPEWLITQFNEELRAFAGTARPFSRTRDTSSRSALKSEKVSEYLLESRRLTTLRKMGTLITANIDEAENEVERLQFEILRILWEEEPVDRYQRELAEKFDLAGLTRPVAQAMQNDQIVDFVSHVMAAAQARKDRSSQRLDAGNAASRQDWRRILNETALVSLERLNCAPDDAELIKLTKCGLPPFSTIENYAGSSEKLDQFHRGDAKIKLKMARKIVGDWSRKQPYRSRPTPEQRDVWIAFLSLKYAFAHELLRNKGITIPSPWLATEIIVLKRI